MVFLPPPQMMAHCTVIAGNIWIYEVKQISYDDFKYFLPSEHLDALRDQSVNLCLTTLL
jgi:hypothetical protein